MIDGLSTSLCIRQIRQIRQIDCKRCCLLSYDTPFNGGNFSWFHRGDANKTGWFTLERFETATGWREHGMNSTSVWFMNSLISVESVELTTMRAFRIHLRSHSRRNVDHNTNGSHFAHMRSEVAQHTHVSYALCNADSRCNVRKSVARTIRITLHRSAHRSAWFRLRKNV